MANPDWTEPSDWEDRVWGAGDIVVWPNGVVGEVWGVDFSDQTLLDETGGWHLMAECDFIPAVAPKRQCNQDGYHITPEAAALVARMNAAGEAS